MPTNMEVLERLTEQLPELDELELSIGGPVVQFCPSMDGGPPSFGFGVHRDEDIGMMRLFMPKGSTIDGHVHGVQHEWFGVIKGHVQVTFTETNDVHEVYNCSILHIPPGTLHIQCAIEDSWCWGVTVPPAAGYPSVTQCPFAAKATAPCM